MNLRQALLRAVLAAVAAMLVFAGPSFGVRGSASSAHGSLRDFSKATATSRPTAAQRAAVKALHAKATWNSYGTASTLMRPGGYLTKQASGATAPVAARSWLAKHKVIFRLDSVRGLRLVADSKLTGGRGHAVTFQQSFERPEGRQRRRPDHRLDGAGQEAPPLEDRLRQLDLARHAALDRQRQAVGGAGLRARGRQPRAEDDPREREGAEGRQRLDEPPHRRLPRHPARARSARTGSAARPSRPTRRSCSTGPARRSPSGRSSTPARGRSSRGRT